LPDTVPADGILVVDKPVGPTSHDLIYAARRKYGIKKIGHAGTLDPLASGLMIILIGREATKRASEFEGLDKVYEVGGILGEARTTYDAEGEPMELNLPEGKADRLQALTTDSVTSALKKFEGTQLQKVPPFSAVKINGKPLYKYAREGNPIPEDQLPAKEITIHSIELVDFTPDPDRPTLRVRIHCTKGTYVRSIIHDLGINLGVGAYVSALRRTQVGDYAL